MRDRPKESSIVCIVCENARDGLKALFESFGLKSQVRGANLGFLAIEHLDEASCLILDVRLASRSASDLQASLARTRTDTPIVFVASHGGITMFVKAMNGGAVDIPPRALRERDLSDAVRAALDRDRAKGGYAAKVQDLRTRYDTLTRREQQVMGLVCSGLMNKHVANKISITEKTVKVHRHNIMRKLGARSALDLVRMAVILEILEN